jgi:nondiscriminating aspartyl-tRNA synthetase
MSRPRRLSRELPGLVGQEVRVAGHLQDYRALGGVAFALLRDRGGLLQVTLKKGESDPAIFALFASLPRESVVEVEGSVAANPRARVGAEVLPRQARLLNASAAPLPLGVADRVGVELDTRFNHRVLDLRKPENQQVMELRAETLKAFRATFGKMGFLEVETPKILRQGAEGGATLFRLDYFGEPAYLAQSPQLYKQMLMATELERVFEIAPAFRAEPSDTNRHLTEFTSIDAEMAYVEEPEELIATVEELVSGTLTELRRGLQERKHPLAEDVPTPARPFPRLPFHEAAQWLGRPPGGPGAEADLSPEDERQLGDLMQEKRGAELYFLTEFPTSLKRGTFYARRQDAHPERTYYFDLEFRGQEMLSGGLREHRLQRLEEQIQQAGLDPGRFGAYLEAFRYGMPPHGGFALGLDRWVGRLSHLTNVREARLFPRDRYRLEP